jgi:ABC-type multidrug transport system fused ATPase/permease subunit
MRASTIYASMKIAMRTYKLRIRNWAPALGSGWQLGYRLMRLNKTVMITQFSLAVVSAVIFYVPALILRELIQYLEADPAGTEKEQGWFLSAALFVATAIMYLLTGQLWSVSTTTFQVRLKVQLNSILFAKTLVRKDVASSAASAKKDDDKPAEDAEPEKKKDENEFSSKAQIMTLMTTDVDRVSEFSWHLFSLIDAPIEIVIGTHYLIFSLW